MNSLNSKFSSDTPGNRRESESGIHLKLSNDSHYEMISVPSVKHNEKEINHNKKNEVITSLKEFAQINQTICDQSRPNKHTNGSTSNSNYAESKLYSKSKLDKPQKVVEANAPNNIKQEITKFGRRFDVVKKTIFRKVKKHLSQQFKAFYDFSKRRRSSKLDYNAEIFGQAHKFAQTLFGDD
jgi:hypothetical protein